MAFSKSFPFVSHCNLLISSYKPNVDRAIPFTILVQTPNLLEEFMRLAAQNTQRNLETCGVLAGYLVINSQCFHFLIGSVNLALLSSVGIPSRCVFFSSLHSDVFCYGFRKMASLTSQLLLFLNNNQPRIL